MILTNAAAMAFPITPNLAYDYSFGQNWNGPPFIEGLMNNAAFPAANGTLKVAVIFMDCSDRRAEDVTQRTPVDYRTVAANFDILFPLPDFYRQETYVYDDAYNNGSFQRIQKTVL